MTEYINQLVEEKLEEIDKISRKKIEEIEMIVRIDELMKAWAAYCHSQQRWKDAIFVEDGPCPYYFGQKIKILFIGRELYGKKNAGDGPTINYFFDERAGMEKLGAFQSRLLYLAYGILNSQCTYEDWLKMDEAKELNKRFAEDAKKIDGAFSYAFMNASKILNTQGTYLGSDFHPFIDDKVNRAFFIREIELLAPDIIVSGNLGDKCFFGPKDKPLFAEFKSKLRPSEKWNDPNCFVWEYTFDSGNKIPWLDAWHFSRIGANFEYFYEPICRIAKALMPVGK